MTAAFDFETCLIRPGLQAPPPVCIATAVGEHADLTATAGLEGKLRMLLRSGGVMVGHNVAYDFCCALEWLDLEEEIFTAYEDDRILDTMILERIAEIGRFTTRKVLSLDVCCSAYGCPLPADKGPSVDWDQWQRDWPNVPVRLSYGPLYQRPLEDYSQPQKDYAIADAVGTLTLFNRQRARYGDRVSLADVAMLTRKALWLQITRNRGMRTDPNRLEQLEAETRAYVAELFDFGVWCGLVRDDGSRDMKALRAWVETAYQGHPPMTDASARFPNGQIATSRAVLEESGDPTLEIFAEFGEWSAIENKDLPMLKAGIEVPIHTKFGIADTTRTTSSKPNLQNFRRKAGIRECVIPRPGYCFLAGDHMGLELVTLAQVIVSNLGLRRMADEINAGRDLHCNVAAEILHCTYDRAIELKSAGDYDLGQARQCGKVVNFGRPGGMGAETLRFYAKQGYGLTLTLEFCKELIAHWEAANPDGREYLDWIGRLPEVAGMREIVIPGTSILRRGCTYCAAANTNFQALGATVEAVTGFELLKATRGAGALGRCRLVNFVHDEFIFECPIGEQHEAAEAFRRIMIEAPRALLPDVAIDAEIVAMDRWSKRAKALLHDGRLAVWSEEAAAAIAVGKAVRGWAA